MRQSVFKWAAAAGVAAVIGCGGGDSGTSPNPPPPPPPAPPPVASVEVSPPAATILVEATASFSATVRDAAGNQLSGRTVAWTSSDPAVASVSSNGGVTGVTAGGPVSITATSEGKSGTAQVTVLAPVASVAVTPPAASLLVGATSTLTATPLDAANHPLTGRTVTWSSSNEAVATVSTDGLVTGVAPGGPVSITATSEGKSGTAQVTVLAPVASVVVTGSFRTKVGDAYQYTATAKLADGTVVTRPMTWSVAEPAKATMTADGQMTPLQTGAITIQVTIDGAVWETTATAYDWLAFGSGTTFGVSLPADLTITNKYGTSEYPTLAMGCSSGLFLLFVDTDNFVTENGLVAYSFDGGAPESAVWLEFDLFSALGHPGPDAATRAFAARMAAARQFGFAFTEFNGPARATIFRVTGLSANLPAFASCPSGAPAAVAGDSSSGGRTARMQAMIGRPTPMTAERALRTELHAAAARVPELLRAVPPTSKAARRRPAPPE